MMTHILIADDDAQITTLLEDSLTDEGFMVTVVHNGTAVLDILRNQSFDLILMDIMMPGMDGLQVCRKIRDTTACPILFLTAKNRTVDTIVGLEIGGDDYITKPFVVEALIAKVKAHIRREKRANTNTAAAVQTIGELQIHPDSYEVYQGTKQIHLSTREFQLLMYFLNNLNKVLTREQIFDGVWGQDFIDMGTVTVTIKNLRDKIDPNNMMIKTVWGIGYKMVMPKGNEV